MAKKEQEAKVDELTSAEINEKGLLEGAESNPEKLVVTEEEPEEEEIPEEIEETEEEEEDDDIDHLAEIRKAQREKISAEFDWNNYTNKGEIYSSNVRADYEAQYDKTLSTIAENECIDGTVISMNKREVVVNIGYKSEGVVSLNEFRYNPELAVGDKVEVYVESQEDKKASSYFRIRKHVLCVHGTE